MLGRLRDTKESENVDLYWKSTEPTLAKFKALATEGTLVNLALLQSPAYVNRG
jgi:hypothetical protein